MNGIDDLLPRDVRYIIAVVREGSLARAADTLGVTQTALTYAVRRVEESLRTKLFVRSPKGMEPTAEATRFCAAGERLLEAWGTLAAAVRSKVEVEGHFTLACHPTVGRACLPHVVPRVMARYPRLVLHIDTSLSREVQAAVAAGRVDFGLVVNPVRTPDLVLRPVATDTFTLWKDRRLGKERCPPEKRTLYLDPHLFQSQRLLHSLQAAPFPFGRIVRVRGLELVAALGAEGGYALLPARVATLFATLREVEVEGGTPARADTFALVYRQRVTQEKGTLLLARALEAELKDALKDALKEGTPSEPRTHAQGPGASRVKARSKSPSPAARRS